MNISPVGAINIVCGGHHRKTRIFSMGAANGLGGCHFTVNKCPFPNRELAGSEICRSPPTIRWALQGPG